MATTFVDTLGVPITLGTRVMVAAYGYGARQMDVGASGVVIGFARSRVVVDITRSACGEPPAVHSLGPVVLAVLAEPGSEFTFEGNRRRSLTTPEE